MIGRRQGEPPNPSKLAKREAKILDDVRRSLRTARVHEHPIGGGTLLTEPILVFHSMHQRDVRVFDRESKELGVARWFSEKAGKFSGYGVYGSDDEVPTVMIRWDSPGGFGANGNYTVLDSERVEIATLSLQRIRLISGLGVMVEGERIGYLSPRGLRWGHVNDNHGREVARIQDIRWARCYVADIEPSIAGRLRAIAVVASIICAHYPLTQPGNLGGG